MLTSVFFTPSPKRRRSHFSYFDKGWEMSSGCGEILAPQKDFRPSWKMDLISAFVVWPIHQPQYHTLATKYALFIKHKSFLKNQKIQHGFVTQLLHFHIYCCKGMKIVEKCEHCNEESNFHFSSFWCIPFSFIAFFCLLLFLVFCLYSCY